MHLDYYSGACPKAKLPLGSSSLNISTVLCVLKGFNESQ